MKRALGLDFAKQALLAFLCLSFTHWVVNLSSYVRRPRALRQLLPPRTARRPRNTPAPHAARLTRPCVPSPRAGQVRQPAADAVWRHDRDEQRLPVAGV